MVWDRLVGAALLLGIAGCASDSPFESATYDDELEDGLIDEEQLRADGPGCVARYPGGSLAGDDLLVLVSKEEGKQLKATWAPSDLVSLGAAMMPGREGVLRLAARDAFGELSQAAMNEEGLDLRVRSAYRSYATQCVTFDVKVRENGLAHAERYSAFPGRSQHQLGTTVDITARSLRWEIEPTMEGTPEDLWLSENAYRFGFVLAYPKGLESLTGYAYEPWHYRYVGLDAAHELEASGLPLETYLQRCLAGDAELACPREEAPEFDPNAGFVGGRCESASDCGDVGAGALCLTDGYPGGMCSTGCSLYCPDRTGAASTFCLAGDGEPATCVSRCDLRLFPENGCRAGFHCEQGRRPNGTAGDVCLPD